MFKRLILSVSLFCAVASVRAEVDYSATLAQIRAAISALQGSLDSIDDYVYDIQLAYLDNLDGGVNSIDTQVQLLLSKVNSIKDLFVNVDSIFTNLYPILIQQYYKVISIDENTQSTVGELMSVNMYLQAINDVISTLQSVIEDYENFKDSIQTPLNNIDVSNTYIETYVRGIYEDVDTIKALFLGEANLRAMLDALWDIKNDIEFFQQQWELQNTDIHEMFLDPFDHSGWQEPYSSIWKYYNRQFDPYAFLPERETIVRVQPSSWGAFQDICNALDAILKGNEAMNYNLIYQCQVVTAIASNLLQGVSEQQKLNEWAEEVSTARDSLNSKMDDVLGIRDNFKVPTPNDFAFFDTSEYYALLERYDVQSLPSFARIQLGGFSGFLNSNDSISGNLDIDSYGFLFTGIRFAFGVIYWGAYVFFMFFLVRFSLKLYRFTISRFTGISVSEKGGT